MAGLTGRKDVTDGLFRHFLDAEKTLRDEVQFVAHEAGVAGRKAAEWVLDNTDSSLREGKNNRNWTFNMRNSLDYDVKRKGLTTTIRTGWISNKEGYFLIQEHGGTVNGITVTPMDALIAGHDEMLKTLTRWGMKTS